MNHKNNTTVCLALAVCLLLSSVTVMAQDARSAAVNDWSRLNSIASGSKLSVKLKNGQAVNGEFGRVTDVLLSLTVKGKSEPVLAYRQALADEIPDTVILLEHPPVFTAGRRAKVDELLWSPDEVEARGGLVRMIDRGGSFTFHGPGQLVGYPILNLDRRGRDLHAPVRDRPGVRRRHLHPDR